MKVIVLNLTTYFLWSYPKLLSIDSYTDLVKIDEYEIQKVWVFLIDTSTNLDKSLQLFLIKRRMG